MVALQLEDGTIYTEEAEINRELASLPIQLKHFPFGTALRFPSLLNQDLFSETEKRLILETHQKEFDWLQEQAGYGWNDLFVLHPGSANLHALMTTYQRYHTHTEAEAFYVLAGSAIFGFVRSDGSQVQLVVSAQDYVHIGAGVEHWFSLAASLEFKAVRYFTTPTGWLPQYTKTVANIEY